MLGSPFYYDVLFDDGPGDVVFHDCMWSGICTCCIQLLHQDSYYQFANESPDLKVEDLNCRTQQSVAATTTTATSTSITPASSSSLSSTTTATTSTSTIAPNNINNNKRSLTPTGALAAPHLLHQQQQQHQQQPPLGEHIPQPASELVSQPASEFVSPPANELVPSRLFPQTLAGESKLTRDREREFLSVRSLTSCRTSPDTINSSSSSSSSSSSASSPSSSSPNCSNSTSPKPIRRREHNDSERKRRDHLRNAFNFLRDQVPRFKAINKKPPRIQILHEATKYVQAIMRESDELERRLQEEKAKHERLKSI